MEKITKAPKDKLKIPHRRLTVEQVSAHRRELDDIEEKIRALSIRKSNLKKVLGERTQSPYRRTNLWTAEELFRTRKDPEYSKCVAFRVLYDPHSSREWAVVEHISERAIALVTPPHSGHGLPV